MYSLLDDNPSIEGYEDIYERSHFAKNIANHILNTSTISSFAIGIIGEWGSGKSDFLLRLKSILDMYPENLIVDFNPWRVKNSDAIIDEFFKSLSKKIQPFNQSITNSIKKYSNSILKNAKETQYRFIDTLFEKWIEEEDLLSQYNSINNAIQFTNKRLIIFIDDIDRLTGSEVMEVLRIIRNTANFSNTFFVIGMDQTYIIDVIRKTKHFSNEDEYLKKVFQLSISLPIFKKEKFASEIAKYLLTDDLSNDDKNKIRNALSRFGFDNSDDLVKLFNSFTNEGLLEKLIDNGRDLRRFCNSFKILFNILKDEADIFDLFILELIRNKNYKVYDKIRTRELLKFKPLNINYFELNEEVWKVNFTDIPDEKVLKNAVETIFSDAKNKTQRKLILPRNFYIYFSYQLFNIISFHEFNLALEKEPDEMINDFKKWLEPKNINEFLNIISYLGESQSLESFKKIIIVLLRLCSYNSLLFYVNNLLYNNWEFNHKIYFSSKNEFHKEFLSSIFQEESVDPFYRATIASHFLNDLINDPVQHKATFFFLQKELQRIVYFLFDSYLNSNPTDPQRTIQFLNLNVYNIVNRNIILYPPACKRFKNYLLSNKIGFKGYVKYVFKPSQTPYNGRLVLEPWIDQIFPDRNCFLDKLIITDFEDTDLNRLKSILISYFEQYFENNKSTIEIVNVADREFLENFLLLK